MFTANTYWLISASHVMGLQCRHARTLKGTELCKRSEMCSGAVDFGSKSLVSEVSCVNIDRER